MKCGEQDRVYRIKASHFTAGVIVRAGLVRRAAPIVSYMRGWSIERVLDYARRKGFVVNCVEEGE